MWIILPSVHSQVTATFFDKRSAPLFQTWHTVLQHQTQLIAAWWNKKLKLSINKKKILTVSSCMALTHFNAFSTWLSMKAKRNKRRAEVTCVGVSCYSLIQKILQHFEFWMSRGKKFKFHFNYWQDLPHKQQIKATKPDRKHRLTPSSYQYNIDISLAVRLSTEILPFFL